MLTASIVTYHHSLEEIRKVIDCVLTGKTEILYIIDNSLNDALRVVEKISDKIRYIHNANIGYGGAHNIAIRDAMKKGSVYHVVINPDVYFEKGVLEKLAEYMDVNPLVGLVMPKVLYPDGKIQYLCKLLPAPVDLFGRRFCPWESYWVHKNERYELRFTGYDKEMEVPSLSGCFMFMRVSVLAKIGGFDERFFMYAEDLDLCRRIGQVAKTMYYPEVYIFHEYAKGSYKNRKLLKYHICSVIKYFNKWGWFFDTERSKTNKNALTQYGK